MKKFILKEEIKEVKVESPQCAAGYANNGEA